MSKYISTLIKTIQSPNNPSNHDACKLKKKQDRILGQGCKNQSQFINCNKCSFYVGLDAYNKLSIVTTLQIHINHE